MKLASTLGIWLYLVVATGLELLIFRQNPGNFTIDLLIIIVAVSSAVVTALFSMNLRQESTAVQYLVLIPVLLVAVLIITLLLSFPIIE